MLIRTETIHCDWDRHLKAPKIVSNGPLKQRKRKFTVCLADSYKLHCIVKCIKSHREDNSTSPTQMEVHHSRLKVCRSTRRKALEAKPEWIWGTFTFCQNWICTKAAKGWPHQDAFVLWAVKCAVNLCGISLQLLNLPFKKKPKKL